MKTTLPATVLGAMLVLLGDAKACKFKIYGQLTFGYTDISEQLKGNVKGEGKVKDLDETMTGQIHFLDEDDFSLTFDGLDYGAGTYIHPIKSKKAKLEFDPPSLVEIETMLEDDFAQKWEDLNSLSFDFDYELTKLRLNFRTKFSFKKNEGFGIFKHTVGLKGSGLEKGEVDPSKSKANVKTNGISGEMSPLLWCTNVIP